jgi:hypothetical protein
MCRYANLFASGDRAFNFVLQLSIEIQKTGCMDCFNDLLPRDLVRYLEEITSQPETHFKRTYGSKLWSPAHRADLIQKV